MGPDQSPDSKPNHTGQLCFDERAVGGTDGARVDRHEMVLHVGAWDDQWHRHYLGGIPEWIDDAIGKRKSRLVRFERLAAWVDSLEGGTAHQAETSAIAFNIS